MSASLNKVHLIGNCTRDPQVRIVGAERAVANFGLAINERYKGKDGEMKESTVFVDITAWGRTAEVVGQYVTKGKPLYVEGRLKLETWDKDGEKRSKLVVVADAVQFLGSRSDSDAPASAPAPAAAAPTRPKPIKTTPADGFSDEPPF